MRMRACHAVWMVGALAMAAHAQQAPTPASRTAPATPQQAASAQPPELVFTRATVQSVFQEDARHYIRLKLGPGSGLPFRTLTFRVRDPALVEPFPPGSAVEFVAQRVDRENTLTALRAAPRLQRFDSH